MALGLLTIGQASWGLDQHEKILGFVSKGSGIDRNAARDQPDGLYQTWHEGTTQLASEGTYQDGVLDGLWRTWYVNGQLASTGEYDEGTPIGTWQYFNVEGKPTWVDAYLVGLVHRHESWTYNPDKSVKNHSIQISGFEDLYNPDTIPDRETGETFHSDGQPDFSYEYAHGQMNGVWRDYDTDGQLIREESYSQDLLHGPSFVYSPEDDGALVAEKNYDFGKLHGPSKTFFIEEESLSMIEEFRNGRRHGLQKVWWSPGDLQEEGNYLNGRPHGSWKGYFRGSSVVGSVGNYTNGLMTGVWRRYHKDSSLAEESTYVDGFLNGVSDHFDRNGDLTLQETYRGGLLHGLRTVITRSIDSPLFIVTESTEYDRGIEVGPRIWSSGFGSRRVTPLLNRRIHGLELFSNDGVISEEIYYVADRRHGSYKTYYNDGTPTLLGQYEDGIPVGLWQSWWYTGQLRTSGRMSDSGQECGIWKEYNIAGEEYPPVDHGECLPNTVPVPPLPLIRGIRGRATVDGVGLPKAEVWLGYAGRERLLSVESTADGTFLFSRLWTQVDTLFTITILHPDHPKKVIQVEVPLEDGVLDLNDTGSNKYTDAVITLGNPDVGGIYFLQRVYMPVTFPASVDWKDDGTGVLEWRQGQDEHTFNPKSLGIGGEPDTFELEINPGFDLPLPHIPGALSARRSEGGLTTSLDFPVGYKVYPQPGWSAKYGGWRGVSPKKNGAPGSYRLTTKWPESPLNIGLESSETDKELWLLWSTIPVIGGSDFGISYTYFKTDFWANTDGTGGAVFEGAGDLRIAGKRFYASAFGSGNLEWRESLNLVDANMLLHAKTDFALAGISLPQVFVPVDNSADKTLQILDGFQMGVKIGADIQHLPRIEILGNSLHIPPYEAKTTASLALDVILNPVKGMDIDAFFGGSITLVSKIEGFASIPQRIEGCLEAKLKATAWGFLLLDWKRAYCGQSAPSIAAVPGTSGTQQYVAPTFLDHGPYAVFEPENANRFETFETPSNHITAASENQPPMASTLVSNIYPYANPSIAERDGQKALVYVHYDPERPEGQSTRLYYSIDSGNGYGEPRPLHVEARADFNPQLAYLPDNRLLAIWETSKLDQLAANLEERLAGLEIAWSVYDGESDAWSAPVLLSNNDHLDFNPGVSASERGSMVFWSSNEKDAFIPDPETPDLIHFAVWNGTSFDPPTELPYETSTLGDPSLAFDGTNAVVAWIQDSDLDLSTHGDTELFVAEFKGSNWGTARQLTTDTVTDHSPHVLCLEDGSLEMIWTKGNQLVRLADWTTLANEVIYEPSDGGSVPDHEIACSSNGLIALVWAEYAETEGNLLHDLFYVLHDPQSDSWSDPIRLTNNQAIERFPAVALSPEDGISVAFLNRDQETELNDLMILSRGYGVDLAVGTPRLSPSSETPGEFEITTELMNLGNRPASNVEVDVYLGDPSKEGTLLDRSTVGLRGGSHTYVVFSSSGLRPEDDGHVFVRIDPLDQVSETNESNNTAVSSFTLRELEDDDGDGIPDTWEIQHFGNLEADGSGDQDSDGFNDFYEYLTLTDPLDPQSNFKFALEPDPNNRTNFLITFPAVTGRVYRIQWSTDLDTWYDHSFNKGNGSDLSVSVPGMGGGSHARFYRIRIEI